MTDQQRKAMEEEKYLEMIRTSEDYYDTIDCEKETREDLEKRQVIMNETRIEKKPYQELYKGINKQINNFAKWKNDKTPWSNMAGPKRDKR
tara:strand:+ start:588 stop:860 length:273 start_codon:yes stop_codon:yes gene_type:complete